MIAISREDSRYLMAFVWAGVVLCLGAQMLQVWTLPVHIDEFRFLADVHLAQRRQLSSPLMSLHVHAFAWLTWMELGDIERITVARLAVLAAEIATCSLIYLVARVRFSQVASLLAVLTYVSFSFVLHHGASFRFDTLSGFVLMLCVALLVRVRPGAWVAATVWALFAVAMLITLKSVIYLPVLLWLQWRRWRLSGDRAAEARWLGIGAMVGALAWVLLFLWHAGYVDHPVLSSARAVAGEGLHVTVLDAGFFPRWKDLVRSAIDNPVHWVVIVGGWLMWIRKVRLVPAEGEASLAGLWIVLLSLVFYRNAYPYFYVFLMIPVVIGASAFFQALRPRAVYAVVSLMLVSAGIHVFVFSYQTPMRSTQEQLHAGVQRLFPEPVAYIDCCSMLPSFRQQGFFMSAWGGDTYESRQKPVLRDAIEMGEPVFVLLNHPRLLSAFATHQRWTGLLLEEDAQALRDNYVPYWGRIYIAGKSFQATRQGGLVNMLVSGQYQVQAQAPVSIDGQWHQPGDRVFLSKGPHAISAEQEMRVTVRWFNGGREPVQPWPVGPLIPTL